MLSFLIQTILPVCITAAIGGIGWFITNMLIGPWRDFLQLRKEIHEAVIFTANVFPTVPDGLQSPVARDERHIQAIHEIRQLAARLQAANHSFWKLHRWYAAKRGYDLDLAGKSMIGLSNSTGDLALIATHRVEKGLKLPVSLSDDVVQEMWKLHSTGGKAKT